MKTLETKRLILRAFTLEDLDDFFGYAQNPNIGPAAGWEPHKDRTVSKEILESFIINKEVWALEEKETGRVIGSIGLHEDRLRPEIPAKMIGFVLDEQYWGKGLATEATKRVIQYAFEDTDTEVIAIRHYPFNAASRRVIEKCGFVYEGTLRHAIKIFDGRVYDLVCYSLLKSGYMDGGNCAIWES